MIDDEKIIEMFFERSEQGIRELDIKYGKACHNLSYHIVGSRQDAEECVNDAYLGAWNAIPPARPNPLLSYLLKIVRNISLKIYWRKEAAKRSSHYTIALEEIEACIADQKTANAEHITSRSININAVSVWIVFCKYCSHRIESPYHSISHLLQKSEAFQSVHHVIFILCYNVLSDFLPLYLPLSEFVNTGGTI